MKIEFTNNPKTSDNAQEWLAHAYFNDGQYKKAAERFQRIITNSHGTTKDRAEWYLVLSLLPDYGNWSDVIIELLDKMIDPANYHNYAGKAKTLQVELNNL